VTDQQPRRHRHPEGDSIQALWDGHHLVQEAYGRQPLSQTVRPTRQRKANRIALATLSMLVVLAITGVVAGCASSPKPTGAKSPHSAYTSATAPAAEPATTQGAAAAVSSWLSEGGKAALDNLANSLGALQKAEKTVKNGNITKVVIACSDLSFYVRQTKSAEPIPYAPAEGALAKALAYYKQAAADCLLAASGGPVSLTATTREFSLGKTWLAKMAHAIQGLTRPPGI
jgi:hypothetical protein